MGTDLSKGSAQQPFPAGKMNLSLIRFRVVVVAVAAEVAGAVAGAAVLEAVRAEREAVIREAREMIRAERETILREASGIAEKTTDSAAGHAERLIDHLMWRVLQLAVLAAVVGLLGWLFYLFRRRKAA